MIALKYFLSPATKLSLHLVLRTSRQRQRAPAVTLLCVKMARWSGAPALSVDPPTSGRVTRHSIAAWPAACRKQEGALSRRISYYLAGGGRKSGYICVAEAKVGRIASTWGSEKRLTRIRRCWAMSLSSRTMQILFPVLLWCFSSAWCLRWVHMLNGFF